MRTIYLILVIFFTTGQIIGQTTGTVFEHITDADGLSQGAIYSIIQDDEGFIWLATKDGLNRYNGYEIKVYRNSITDTNTISNSYIRCLVKDDDGNIWIGTNNGLNKYDQESDKFIRYQLQMNNSGPPLNIIIYSLYWDSPNTLYIGTNYNGLFKMDIDTEEIEYIYYSIEESKPGIRNFIYSICQTSNEWIWFNSALDLFYYDNNQVHQIDPETIDVITQSKNLSRIKAAGDSSLWISSVGFGLVKYNYVSGETNHLFDREVPYECSGSYFLRDFIVDGDLIWGASDYCGLVRFDLVTREIINYRYNESNPYSILSNNILSLFLGRDGLLWIGTNGRGLCILNPDVVKFANYSSHIIDPQTNNPMSIRAVFLDQDGILWVGGYGALYRIDRKMEEVKIALEGYSIYSLVDDHNNNNKLLIGLDGSGFIIYDKPTGKHLQYNFIDYPYLPVKGEFFYKILPDSNYLWMCTEYGLNRYNPEKKKNILYAFDDNNPKSIPVGSVKEILKDNNGGYWVGTDIGGLGYFDGITDEFYTFRHIPADTLSLSNNTIYDIFEDSHYNIWIGTNNGLNRYNQFDQSFIHYTMENGLPNNVIYCIMEDDDRNLWLSTNIGICRFNPATLDIKNFDIGDGLQSNEFNAGAYFQSAGGEMFMGGVNGLNSFYPSQIKENTIIPELRFTNLKIGNKDIDLSPAIHNRDEIILDHDDGMITIEFSALNYYKPYKNHYAYKVVGLEGFEDEWIPIGNKNFIDFTALQPGTYILKVIGSNNDDIWNEEGASLRLIITPPFWETTWFIIIVAATVLLFLYLFYMVRLSAIKRQQNKLKELVEERTHELSKANTKLSDEINERARIEEELRLSNQTKDKFFSIIGHDLKNPLSSLLGFSKLLYAEYDDFTDVEKKTFVKDIKETSENLYKLAENILFWARSQTGSLKCTPDNIDLRELVQDNIELLEATAGQKNIKVTNELNTPVLAFADNNMVTTVIRNLISNAIKFTPRNGSINISLCEEKDHVCIEIKDNGLGIAERHLSHLFKISEKTRTYGTEKESGTGLGLVICKEFITQNNGKIWVKSQEGKGSSFFFTLPTAKDKQ